MGLVYIMPLEMLAGKKPTKPKCEYAQKTNIRILFFPHKYACFLSFTEHSLAMLKVLLSDTCMYSCILYAVMPR